MDIELNEGWQKDDAFLERGEWRRSYEFMIQYYKVLMCCRGKHDKKKCPFYHDFSERRRKRCARGGILEKCDDSSHIAEDSPGYEECQFWHNTNECIVQPGFLWRFKCNKLPKCERHVCFYWHTTQQHVDAGHRLPKREYVRNWAVSSTRMSPLDPKSQIRSSKEKEVRMGDNRGVEVRNLSFKPDSFLSLADKRNSGEPFDASRMPAESVAVEGIAASKLAAESVAVEGSAASKLTAESVAVEGIAASKLAAESVAVEGIAASSRMAAESVAVEGIAASRMAAESAGVEGIAASRMTAESVGVQGTREQFPDAPALRNTSGQKTAESMVEEIKVTKENPVCAIGEEEGPRSVSDRKPTTPEPLSKLDKEFVRKLLRLRKEYASILRDYDFDDFCRLVASLRQWSFAVSGVPLASKHKEIVGAARNLLCHSEFRFFLQNSELEGLAKGYFTFYSANRCKHAIQTLQDHDLVIDSCPFRAVLDTESRMVGVQLNSCVIAAGALCRAKVNVASLQLPRRSLPEDTVVATHALAGRGGDDELRGKTLEFNHDRLVHTPADASDEVPEELVRLIEIYSGRQQQLLKRIGSKSSMKQGYWTSGPLKWFEYFQSSREMVGSDVESFVYYARSKRTEANVGVADWYACKVIQNVKGLTETEHEDLDHLRALRSVVSSVEFRKEPHGERGFLVHELGALDLQRLVDENQNALGPKAKRYLMEQIVVAVKALHDRGCVYGDLRPSNVFLFKNGVVKLGPLRVCRTAIARSNALQPYEVCSMTDPESKEGKDPLNDVFQLGMIFCFIATGFFPFGDHKLHSQMPCIMNRSEPSMPWLEEKTDFLPFLNHLIKKMVKHNLHKRFTMRQLLNHHFFQSFPALERPLPLNGWSVSLAQTFSGDLKRLGELGPPDSFPRTRFASPQVGGECVVRTYLSADEKYAVFFFDRRTEFRVNVSICYQCGDEEKRDQMGWPILRNHRLVHSAWGKVHPLFPGVTRSLLRYYRGTSGEFLSCIFRSVPGWEKVSVEIVYRIPLGVPGVDFQSETLPLEWQTSM